MNCSQTQEHLSEYFDGELADASSALVADHLSQCVECAAILSRYEQLAGLARTLETPLTPPAVWDRLERELDPTPAGARQTRREARSPREVESGRSDRGPEETVRRAGIAAGRWWALAATVLVAIGIGWGAYSSWFSGGGHPGFADEFAHYVKRFQRDPAAAQQFLLAQYENDALDPEQAVRRVGYRPVVAEGMPEGYQVMSTHLMKMPCCTCVQSVCRRADGSTLAIFEHDEEAMPNWSGEQPCVSATCRGKACCLVELDHRIAVTWKRDSRHITLIGVQDLAEVDQLVAWMDGPRDAPPE